jgi:hypothetical protein
MHLRGAVDVELVACLGGIHMGRLEVQRIEEAVGRELDVVDIAEECLTMVTRTGLEAVRMIDAVEEAVDIGHEEANTVADAEAAAGADSLEEGFPDTLLQVADAVLEVVGTAAAVDCHHVVPAPVDAAGSILVDDSMLARPAADSLALDQERDIVVARTVHHTAAVLHIGHQIAHSAVEDVLRNFVADPGRDSPGSGPDLGIS